jgi:hypothetical protein
MVFVLISVSHFSNKDIDLDIAKAKKILWMFITSSKAKLYLNTIFG